VTSSCQAGEQTVARPLTDATASVPVHHDKPGWLNTLDAEYVALIRLQADAFTTLDAGPAKAIKDLVRIAPIEALGGLNRQRQSSWPTAETE